MTMNATTVRPTTLHGRLGVPWLTVLPLAVVMAYADGFWMTSLRGAVGAIERTQEPFASWLRESTLSLPLFVLAVLGALTLAARRFGPVLAKPKTIVAAALLIVAAGTLVGIGEVAASSAYDYHLQSGQIQLMNTMAGMESTTTVGWMPGMASTASTGSIAQQQRASLALQERALLLGSGILLATNLILVGWVIAIRGGRLNVTTARQRAGWHAAATWSTRTARWRVGSPSRVAKPLWQSTPALPALADEPDPRHPRRFHTLTGRPGSARKV